MASAVTHQYSGESTMLTVKATQSLLKFMRAKPDQDPPVSTGKLGPWLAKTVETYAGEVIVCMNEATFLTVIFPSGYVNLLVPQLYDRTYDLLRRIGIPEAVACTEVNHYRQITFTRTDSQRMLGVLNEIGREIQILLDIEPGLTLQRLAEIERSISQSLYGAPDYTKPVEAVRALLLS